MLYLQRMDATLQGPPKRDTVWNRLFRVLSRVFLWGVLLLFLPFALKFWGDNQESAREQHDIAAMTRWACLINAMGRAHPEKKLEDLLQEYREPPVGVPKTATLRVLRPDERRNGRHDRDFVIETPPNPIGIQIYSDGEGHAYTYQMHLAD